MNITAVFLVLLSAIFHSLRNIFTKQSVDKQLFLWWYTIWGLIYFLPVFIYFMWQSGIPNLSVIGLCFFSGFLHFIYWVFLTKAYEVGDISLTYPIMRSSPALVFLIAVLFLNEKVSVGGVAGIIVVMCGIYFLSFGQTKILKQQLTKVVFFKDQSIQYALMGLVSITSYSIADKLIVEYINPIVFVFLHMLFGFMCYSIYIYFRKKKYHLNLEWKTNKTRILLAGFLGIYGYSLIIIAYTIERVSYIVGLRQLSIVFVVFWGGYYLNEKQKLNRLISALVITGGVCLISMLG